VVVGWVARAVSEEGPPLQAAVGLPRLQLGRPTLRNWKRSDIGAAFHSRCFRWSFCHMARRFRVVIADFITGDLEPERRVLGDIADVVALDAYREAELAGPIDDADAIML